MIRRAALVILGGVVVGLAALVVALARDDVRISLDRRPGALYGLAQRGRKS